MWLVAAIFCLIMIGLLGVEVWQIVKEKKAKTIGVGSNPSWPGWVGIIMATVMICGITAFVGNGMSG